MSANLQRLREAVGHAEHAFEEADAAGDLGECREWGSDECPMCNLGESLQQARWALDSRRERIET